MKKEKFKNIITVDLSESSIDIESRTINGAVIMSQISRGSNGKVRRRYTDNALNSAKTVLEGAGACIDHDYKEKNKPRSPLSYYGVYSGLSIKPDVTGGSKLYGNLTVFEGADGDKMLSIAKSAPHLIGNSIRAGGMGRVEKGIEVIEEILPVTHYGQSSTIDMVTSPATNKDLFESIQDDDQNLNKKQKRKNKMEIDLNEATLEQVKILRPDIIATLDQSGEVKTLTESNAKLETENKDMKEKLDVFEATANLAGKKEMVLKMLTASKLPKELITDTFKNSLMNVQESTDDKGVVISIEDGIKHLIKDRALLKKTGVKSMGGSSDIFEGQGDGDKVDVSKMSGRDIAEVFGKTRG